MSKDAKKALQVVDLESPEITWEGAVSVERRQDYHKPWRIPYGLYDYFPPQGIDGSAQRATCVRISFASNTDVVHLKMFPLDTDLCSEHNLDIVCDGHLEKIVTVRKGEGTCLFPGLPSREKKIEIYLPPAEFKLIELSIRRGSTLKPIRDKRPRWIVYGSSITECVAVPSRSQTWPVIVAQAKNLHLTCLGFGGNCHAEPMIARVIRDLPADFISLCLGINIHGGNSLSPRTFQPAVIGFIQIIREKHPCIPVAVCSPIISPPRETQANAVGFTLVEMRKQILEVTKILNKNGDENVYYIDGLKLLGEEFSGYLPDQLHPNVEGYRILAKNFEKEAFSRISGENIDSGATAGMSGN